MALAPAAIKTAILGRVPRDGRALRRLLWPESGALSPIPAVDGLRALAVLLVLLYHAWSYVPGFVTPQQNAGDYPIFYGKTGVNLFFVLSGFLLFLPYAQWIFGMRGRPSALAFYKRRVLRVGPAYWVSLVLLAILTPFSLATLGDFLVHTVFLLNTSWGTMYTFNGVYWTMAIEVQFYATLPLIAWGMFALTRWLRPGLAILGGIVGLLGISAAAVGIEATGVFIKTPFVSSFLISFASLPYWLVVFGCGIGCAALYTYVAKITRVDEARRRVIRRVGTVAFIASIGLALATASVTTLQRSPMMDQIFGLAYAGLLLGVLFGPALCRRLFESRPLRFLGLISYSFYIWHKEIEYPAAHLIRRLPVFQQQVALFALTLIGTTIVAYVSYQLIERPFISARKRAHEPIAVAQPAPLEGVPELAGVPQ